MQKEIVVSDNVIINKNQILKAEKKVKDGPLKLILELFHKSKNDLSFADYLYPITLNIHAKSADEIRRLKKAF